MGGTNRKLSPWMEYDVIDKTVEEGPAVVMSYVMGVVGDNEDDASAK